MNNGIINMQLIRKFFDRNVGTHDSLPPQQTIDCAIREMITHARDAHRVEIAVLLAQTPHDSWQSRALRGLPGAEVTLPLVEHYGLRRYVPESVYR